MLYRSVDALQIDVAPADISSLGRIPALTAPKAQAQRRNGAASLILEVVYAEDLRSVVSDATDDLSRERS
jgi:hypothetical protein